MYAIRVTQKEAPERPEGEEPADDGADRDHQEREEQPAEDAGGVAGTALRCADEDRRGECRCLMPELFMLKNEGSGGLTTIQYIIN